MKEIIIFTFVLHFGVHKTHQLFTHTLHKCGRKHEKSYNIIFKGEVF